VGQPRPSRNLGSKKTVTECRGPGRGVVKKKTKSIAYRNLSSTGTTLKREAETERENTQRVRRQGGKFIERCCGQGS